MNDRQRKLYELLLLYGEYPIKQADIGRIFIDDYDDCDCKDYHNSHARQVLTADIREINNDLSVEKIIVSSKNGIKLATKDEAIRYIKRQYAALFRKLKRIRTLEKKARLDGQFKIFTDENGDFVSSFVEE